MASPSPSKRGLAWPTTNQEPTHIFTRPGSLITWLYNWSPLPPASSSIPFIAMQWNHIDIDTLPEKLTQNNCTTLLGFNEPELASQSAMSVELAAREWLRVIEPLRKHGVRAGSPGISSAPEGVGWLKDFLAAIRRGGGDVDFYALHWYGEGLGPFYDYLWSAYYQLGADRPVWVTEFACTNWRVERPLEREVVREFCVESCKYLDSLEWVERYSWFGAMRDCGSVGKWAALVDEKGVVTELGKAYRDGT